METPTPSSAARDENATSEFSAAFPPQFTILGVKLLPLSLGRYRLMKFAEVAFVSEQECNATMDDLFTGIAICGMRCEDFKSLLLNGKLERELKRWGKKLRKMIRKEKGFNVFEKISLFNRYIKEGQELPWIPLPVQSGDVPETTRTHWSTSVEVVLRSCLGWGTKDIEENPLNDALMQYFKHMENEGCVKLMPHNLYQQMVDEGQSNMEAFEKLAAAKGAV